MKASDYQIVRDLETLKDTAKMKAHLMKLRATDKMKELDSEYSKFVEQTQVVAESAKETKDEFFKQSEAALERLKTGYEEILRDLNE